MPSIADLYPWLKACHVAAAITFVSGVLAVSLFLAAVAGDPGVGARVAGRMRRWNRAVTTPAMLLVWALGFSLVVTGQWLVAGWLGAKLPLVLVLTGLHGVQSGQLRRLAGGAEQDSTGFAPLALGCAVAIALLAVAKPF